MPIYYFLAPTDDEGTELPGDDVAREQARLLFGEMLRDGAPPKDNLITVLDQAGGVLCRLRLHEE